MLRSLNSRLLLLIQSKNVLWSSLSVKSTSNCFICDLEKSLLSINNTGFKLYNPLGIQKSWRYKLKNIFEIQFHFASKIN